jgi:hypothetical protein
MPCVIAHLGERQYASILIFQNLKYLTGKLHTVMKALSVHEISGMKVSVIQLKRPIDNLQKCLVSLRIWVRDKMHEF